MFIDHYSCITTVWWYKNQKESCSMQTIAHYISKHIFSFVSFFVLFMYFNFDLTSIMDYGYLCLNTTVNHISSILDYLQICIYLVATTVKLCVNQTLTKQESCVNQTLTKQESCVNQTQTKPESCIYRTLNKVPM